MRHELRIVKTDFQRFSCLTLEHIVYITLSVLILNEAKNCTVFSSQQSEIQKVFSPPPYLPKL